jgi:hypothetical protein
MHRIYALAILVLTACAGDTTAPFSDEAAFNKNAKVTVSDPTATWLIPVSDTGLSLRSDGQQVSHGNSVYANDVCGVTTRIFATTAGSGSGDATIRLDAATGKGCGRTFTIVYPDGRSETLRSFANLWAVHSPTSSIPIGATELRRFVFNPSAINVSSRCGRLIFGESELGGAAGSDRLEVTRVDARTWHVQSQPEDRNALCENTGALYEMSVEFTVVASQDLQ